MEGECDCRGCDCHLIEDDSLPSVNLCLNLILRDEYADGWEGAEWKFEDSSGDTMPGWSGMLDPDKYVDNVEVW